MKKEKTTKKISFLDYMCIPGERVQWYNLKGERFEGKLIIIDDNYLATVELDDGSTIEIQC
jgi:hypothetical protein